MVTALCRPRRRIDLRRARQTALYAALMVLSGQVWAAPKLHALPAADEARWIAAVEVLKADDGSTVLQTLQYAQHLRPTKFKFGNPQALYQAGEPIGIGFDYWIGQKRLPDDAFTMMFDVKADGRALSVSAAADTPAAAALAGRDALIAFVDQEYQGNCVIPETGAHFC